MGKITIYEVSKGNAKVKIDSQDTIWFDQKKPHVSIECGGTIYINHLMLDEIDSMRVDHKWPKDVQDSFYEVRKRKAYVEKRYWEANPGKK